MKSTKTNMKWTFPQKLNQQLKKMENEVCKWLVDLEHWNKEIIKLKRDLSSVEEVVNNHLKAYDRHLSAISKHNLYVNVFDVNFSLRNPVSEIGDIEVKEYEEEERKHDIQRVIHQNLKDYHRELAEFSRYIKKWPAPPIQKNLKAYQQINIKEQRPCFCSVRRIRG